MDNQTPTPNLTPPTENISTENPAVETPPQVYTAPHIDNPPPKKSFLTDKIILISIILLILLGTGTYLALNSKPQPQPVVSKATPTPVPTPTPDPTTNWKIYENTKYHYSIKYPKEWSIVEGVSTNPEKITFSSPTSNMLDPKPALVSVIAVNKTEFNSDWVNNYGPFAYKTFDKDDKVFAIIANTYMEGAAASKEIEQLAKNTLEKMVSTFKFTESSPIPACRPRPACLDATPRCLIPETADMCPKLVVCTQDAKLCPDGKTYVGRQGLKCEFAPCPGQ